MAKYDFIKPDYIFEVSWEVCNKVGGIYTVLSTRARTLQEAFRDKILFIGPDCAGNPDFKESTTLFSAWKKQINSKGNVKVRVGRWDIPGKPIAFLVDFSACYKFRDSLYFRMWEKFRVNSMHSYGDYDEACMFSCAAAEVIADFYHFHALQDQRVIAHFNEWTTGMGALSVKDRLPEVATVFTTHATTIGRSIAFNDFPLYSGMESYDGDEMAARLNVEAKHSLEKQTALHVDAFTTVSDFTAVECARLLRKVPDVVTPNGFEPDFVPKPRTYQLKRKAAREKLCEVVEKLTGSKTGDDPLMIAISGRYEYKNKGIDVFIEALDRVRKSNIHRTVLAFIMVPGWIDGSRTDLRLRLQRKAASSKPLPAPYFTHNLCDPENDKVCRYLHHLNFENRSADKVKIVFIPSYLNGDDGILDLSYYDLLPAMDLTIFPSYYEPWGYTPLESIAFGIPTITTNLAGFGLWAMKENKDIQLHDGVEVIFRDDTNYFEVAEKIKEKIVAFSSYTQEETGLIKTNSFALAEKASWSHFIEYYYEAYDKAFRNHLQERK